MGLYITLYFIFTNGTFTWSPPTCTFLFISHPDPETSILLNFPKLLHQRQWHPVTPPSLPLSIPPSLHPRSVYSFDFTPRFIRSIPMSSTPSPFSFTQIHLITSAAVANQRIRECEKKINMAHPGAGGVLEQRFASVRWDERMSWNVKIHCNGLWDE